MSSAIIKREQKAINVEELSDTEIDALSDKLSAKVKTDMDGVTNGLKRLLAQYNLDVCVTYFIHPAGVNPVEFLKAAKKPAKSKKSTKKSK